MRRPENANTPELTSVAVYVATPLRRVAYFPPSQTDSSPGLGITGELLVLCCPRNSSTNRNMHFLQVVQRPIVIAV